MPATATPLPLNEHLRRHARATPDRTAYLWYGRPIPWAAPDAALAARLTPEWLAGKPFTPLPALRVPGGAALINPSAAGTSSKPGQH